MLLTNLILPGRGTKDTFDVEVSESDNKIISIQPHQSSSDGPASTPPARVLPTLCHPHIHLDKPFLLTSHNEGPDLPNYLDLAPQDGTFAEALAKTGEAKQRYTHADLLLRGSQLIAESIQAGVTSMRAFVEVDQVTQFKCVEAGIELKHKFVDLCHVQLCVFAQDPGMNEEKHGFENRQLVEEAVKKYRGDIEALGTTPYVEGEADLQKKNVDWAVQLALENKLHLDFHLDYNLDEKSQPMVWHVIETIKKLGWADKMLDKTVVVGHCSRTTLFDTAQMEELAREIRHAQLPVYFVGLPTSDLFMMGRPSEGEWGGSRPRGTMQILEMIKRFDLKGCIGVNNVGNAFTPWGTVDPLRLASLCVGIYQAGTTRDAELLFECIAALAQEAIGLKKVVVRSIEEGANALFMVVENDANIDIGQHSVPARKRLSVADMVWDPPDLSKRRLIGKLATT